MDRKKTKHITIRVYAIIINEENEVLLSDEFRLGMKMTKFPGGGLEFGEGTVDCLEREAIEEFGQELEVLGHFYTTDYFQPALHDNNLQVLSIYYLARFKDKIKFKISTKAFDFDKLEDGSQSFRWQAIKTLKTENLSLPIDKKAIGILKGNY